MLFRSKTPFAEGKDRDKIGQEIDLFNSICRNAASEMNCNYIDITDSQRKDAANPEFLADDKLHPSGKEYAKWAGFLFEGIKNTIE